ncbi:MAG: IS481 family transposase [Clostridia bacterium]|nr:IS481 family transposase [Clostridia bacterium]
MPWEKKSVEEQRQAFAKEAQTAKNFSELCRKYEISRKTGYKWLGRYENEESLCDKSHARKFVGNKTESCTENLILSMRAENPEWGGKKIREVLMNQGYDDLPCIKTFNNILKRNGCISREASLAHTPYKRFEKEHCNDMWQTDFKGEFKMLDGNYCYPLDIIDDHSRFLIKIKPYENTRNVVISTFESAFREYGMPKTVLCDNGPQFSGLRKGYTQFEKWLMNLDILPIHGRIVHPQTQGKIERFHRTLKNELLKHKSFADISEADECLQSWRLKYNNVRPHEALGMLTPADVYIPSERQYLESIPNYEYSGQFHVIKVNSWGYVRFDKWQTYLSETMIGEHIEFRPNPHGDSFIACYRNFKIATFDANTGQLINRNISRL